MVKTRPKTIHFHGIFAGVLVHPRKKQVQTFLCPVSIGAWDFFPKIQEREANSEKEYPLEV